MSAWKRTTAVNAGTAPRLPVPGNGGNVAQVLEPHPAAQRVVGAKTHRSRLDDPRIGGAVVVFSRGGFKISHVITYFSSLFPPKNMVG